MSKQSKRARFAASAKQARVVKRIRRKFAGQPYFIGVVTKLTITDKEGNVQTFKPGGLFIE